MSTTSGYVPKYYLISELRSLFGGQQNLLEKLKELHQYKTSSNVDDGAAFFYFEDDDYDNAPSWIKNLVIPTAYFREWVLILRIKEKKLK